MKIRLVMAAFLGWFASAQAQPTNSFPLWPEGAPGALGKEDKDIPTLTPYWPDPAKASGAAVVICPGGGYGMLAGHEGEHYARFLNEKGQTVDWNSSCAHGLPALVGLCWWCSWANRWSTDLAP